MSTKHNVRTYNLSISVRRADGLPNQWVAHCLDLDVFTQGNAPYHAIEMVAEAAFETIADDIARGAEPLERRAPKVCWDEFWSIQKRPTEPIDDPRQLDSRQDQIGTVVGTLTLTLSTNERSHEQHVDEWDVPMMRAEAGPHFSAC